MTEPDDGKPDVFVLVHGAWDGGWIWQPLRRRLVAAGADVYAPSLTGSADREHLASPDVALDTYVADIVNLIRFEELKDAILVGYSFGGMTATAAAPRVREHLSQLIYLDAFRSARRTIVPGSRTGGDGGAVSRTSCARR